MKTEKKEALHLLMEQINEIYLLFNEQNNHYLTDKEKEMCAKALIKRIHLFDQMLNRELFYYTIVKHKIRINSFYNRYKNYTLYQKLIKEIKILKVVEDELELLSGSIVCLKRRKKYYYMSEIIAIIKVFVSIYQHASINLDYLHTKYNCQYSGINYVPNNNYYENNHLLVRYAEKELTKLYSHNLTKPKRDND